MIARLVQMRFLAVLISSLALSSAPAICATLLTDRLVELLDQTCVAPGTPEGMIEAGNRLAATQGWKLLGAGPAPLPIMHNQDGPKIAFLSAWELSPLQDVRLAISIVRPEMPGVKRSTSLVQSDADIAGDSLAKSVERRFGAAVTKDTSGRYKNTEIWFFSEERARGNCGRQITILYDGFIDGGKAMTLMFQDLAAPDDGDWSGLRAAMIACRRQ